MIRALVLNREGDRMQADIGEVEESQLPDGDVLIDVAYSSLNFKDGLAITGKGKIIRGEFPFVPGIDLAGVVLKSDAAEFAPGDRVILTGWGTGEERWGGYASRMRASAGHLVPLPEGLSLFGSMAIGTAGFTAMLSVMALEEHGLRPDRGEIVVTGASGGVGSMAVSLLARLGYRVVAATGSKSAHAYLEELGASRIIDRQELSRGPARALESAQWAGAVDNVGSTTLSALIAQTDRHGVIASCGNAGGPEINTTVFPFILRGLALVGIDSNTCPPDRRRAAWSRLAELLSEDDLRKMSRTIALDEVEEFAERITRGETQGRIVVELEGEFAGE
jgi:acrylyl-CoA reductase (NADPH)